MINTRRWAVVLGVLSLAWGFAGPAYGFDEDPSAGSHGGTPAAASHEDDSGHGEKPTLFTGDLGNIFWSLVTFIAVIAVLGRFAWGPLLGALKRREEFIANSLAQAKGDREAAEARLKEYEAKLDAARKEATAIVEEGRRDAEAVRHKIEAQAKAESDAMVERARREIEIATDTAIKELYSLTARMATDVAGRIVHKELDAAGHEQLVQESIAAMSQLARSKG